MNALFKTIENISRYGFYSFIVTEFLENKVTLSPGDSLRIEGAIQNSGLRHGTVYLVIKMSDPYDHDNLILNTDEHWDETSKQKLRLQGINCFKKKKFCFDIPIPKETRWGVIDVKLEVWTPAQLYKRSTRNHFPYLFHETEWKGFVDVIAPSAMIAKVFLSYSWHSNEHIAWVNELAMELKKFKIETVLDQSALFPGEEITLFMEEATTQIPICVSICSSSYVEKANKRERGVGYEISILTNEILEGRKNFAIIPVFRDNPGKKRPTCFASKLHLDMDVDQWKAKPMAELVRSITHTAERLNRK